MQEGYLKRKKGLNPKGKTWQAEYAPSINEESDCEESDTEGQQREEENEEYAPTSETREAQNLESKNAGKGTHQEDMQLMEVPVRGSKHAHESENSDSDKDKTSEQPAVAKIGTELIVVAPQQEGWTKVKKKKKGKKGKLEDYYNP